jgi:hypothetical protein
MVGWVEQTVAAVGIRSLGFTFTLPTEATQR